MDNAPFWFVVFLALCFIFKSSLNNLFSKRQSSPSSKEPPVDWEQEERDFLRGILSQTSEIIAPHSETLIKNRILLVTKNDYGYEEDKGWRRHLSNFYEAVILPELQRKMQNSWEDSVRFRRFEDDSKMKMVLKNSLMDAIDQAILCKEGEYKEKYMSEAGEAPLDPIEYEKHCELLLGKSGWITRRTPRTGDQGADIIAKRNSQVLVVQCKRHASTIGNKAVQEIYAAQKYYNADFAAVVTNQTYTPSAKRLAKANRVLLLHHNDLLSLEFKEGRIVKVSRNR